MYNRYIQQSDGSYRKNRMPDQSSRPPQRPQTPNPHPCEAPHPQPPSRRSEPAGSFLKQLLPKDFDTADLLVVLLLLLMTGDCREERNNALLTMALYLFL